METPTRVYHTVPKSELVQAYDNLVTVIRLKRPEGEFQDAAKKVCRELRPWDYDLSLNPRAEGRQANPRATTFAAIRAVVDTHLYTRRNTQTIYQHKKCSEPDNQGSRCGRNSYKAYTPKRTW